MDMTTLIWRDALRKKIEAGTITSNERVGILTVWHGECIETAKWGVVDRDAQAIPSGVKVSERARGTGP